MTFNNSTGGFRIFFGWREPTKISYKEINELCSKPLKLSQATNLLLKAIQVIGSLGGPKFHLLPQSLSTLSVFTCKSFHLKNPSPVLEFVDVCCLQETRVLRNLMPSLFSIHLFYRSNETRRSLRCTGVQKQNAVCEQGIPKDQNLLQNFT